MDTQKTTDEIKLEIIHLFIKLNAIKDDYIKILFDLMTEKEEHSVFKIAMIKNNIVELEQKIMDKLSIIELDGYFDF